MASQTCFVMALEAILIKSMKSRLTCLSFPCFGDVLWIPCFLTRYGMLSTRLLLSGCEMCAAIWSES